MTDETDVLVIGSGIAGCGAALAAAREGADVCLVTKATGPEDAATDWAQGGIAVTRSEPAAFRDDILAAGDGRADPAAVDVLVSEARETVRDVLIDTVGVEFDAADSDRGDDPLAGYDLAREAAHSTERILHVDAATGRHVLRPFLAHLDDHPSIRLREDTAALDLLTHEGRVHGAVVDTAAGGEPIYAGATVLATGGVGACFPESTNPDGATGDGIAMAALAGADVADMAFVQFHPTAYPGDDPFLVSEAVRGAGAVLRDGTGERFMPARHPDAELAPRDVVARAVRERREATGEAVLDVSGIEFAAEFPGLAANCADRGIEDAIPVAPAEHFLCGGIDVDDRGRTSLGRLFAVGECARTGVHGANRLASTGLLEGLVWGRRAGVTAAGHEPTRVEATTLRTDDPELPDRFADEKLGRLRRIVGARLGIERTPAGISRAAATLRRLKGEVDAYTRTRTSRSLYELRNACITALLIARGAGETPPAGCHHLVDDGPEVSTRAD
ncbi:aspartate oxidase [Halobacteriales archaeon SW_7_68_16]|nr:MAG: aspartate oxidase [Halobacteriales archaeon SW_7_68_16]